MTMVTSQTGLNGKCSLGLKALNTELYEVKSVWLRAKSEVQGPETLFLKNFPGKQELWI